MLMMDRHTDKTTQIAMRGLGTRAKITTLQ